MKKIFLTLLIAFFISNTAFADDIVNPQRIYSGLRAYIAEAQDKVDKNWNPPRVPESYHIVLLYVIDKEGKANFYKALKSSNYSAANDAAHKAVLNSSPFDMPKTAGLPNDIKVEFVFDYKAAVSSAAYKKPEFKKKDDSLAAKKEEYWKPSNEFSVNYTPSKTKAPITISKELDRVSKNYIKNMEDKISKNWDYTKGDASKKVVVRFTIDADGNIVNPVIKTSSNDKKMDNSAIEALKKTAKLDPPKDAGFPDDVKIDFIFDYNLIKK